MDCCVQYQLEQGGASPYHEVWSELKLSGQFVGQTAPTVAEAVRDLIPQPAWCVCLGFGKNSR